MFIRKEWIRVSNMKKIILLLSTLIMSVSMIGCVDQKSESQSTNSDENRIIATSVAVCEILEKLNLDVVGIPTSSYERPEKYSNAKEVGSPMSPDMEIVKSLNPTDVIGSNTLIDELKSQYDAIGVNSTFVNLSSVSGMFKSILDLGEKYDRNSEAEELVNEFKTYMSEYQGKHEGKKSPRVLILMGFPGSYLVATENSYVGNLVSLAGGTNVFQEETNEDFVNVNTEELAKLNPDIILRTSHALPEEVKEMFAEEFETNDIWKHFKAVQEGKVYDLESTLFGMSANFNYQKALESLDPILFSEE